MKKVSAHIYLLTNTANETDVHSLRLYDVCSKKYPFILKLPFMVKFSLSFVLCNREFNGGTLRHYSVAKFTYDIRLGAIGKTWISLLVADVGKFAILRKR